MILYYPVIDTSIDGYGNEKIGDRWEELSPVDNVYQSPTLVLHGTGDTVTPFAGAKRFACARSRNLPTHLLRRRPAWIPYFRSESFRPSNGSDGGVSR